ncbi:MAG: chemotaxis protein [Oscillatoriales cyanobacterium]|uniref:Chemotaxis protein n=1 Tax=Microcoleus anatoxicus PTRS2 TaxID=2705321 RepID=A0ABU8YP96_9CYAN|nr:MAG: chemotaxis protein [Oscillatoriales cyanobacterium]TAD96407.1 MAG: chemotaxis protein [Oscillatoriales cyanobacterium]TAE02227.1 MAG: chemotaxis protein [Oscillatoriales cyanobacterium]TAF03460.1 MAG: chemotaxis protein [Oscillatoriales cyanobacterium]TAF37134.1 MAG: chemotaxis protein [Oscillatoriales cyanobacterium]
MSNLSNLTPDSTIGHLPSHQFQVSSTTLGQVVAQKFGQQPELPGVIITHNSQVLGMISRVKFQEQMNIPDRVELYGERPIRFLLDFLRIPPLLLSEKWKIDDAVQAALNRQKDLVYEPIIVEMENRNLRILDVHTLLMAQSNLLTQANKIIQKYRLERQKYVAKIQQEQAKVQEYSQLLESRQRQAEKSHQAPNPQQAALVKQAQEISQQNQQFLKIAKLISAEGRLAFQATFQGANAICNNTDKILGVGKAIANDLETVNRTSRTIGEAIEQVRHLAVQVAVVTNQMGNQPNGLSQVSSEIARLASKTFELGTQMEQIASRFKLRVQALTEAARAGANVAKSVTEKIERAEMALLDLEEFISEKDVNSSKSKNQIHLNEAEKSTSLIQEIQQAEVAVSELEHIVKQQDSSQYLIQKIQQALKHKKP